MATDPDPIYCEDCYAPLSQCDCQCPECWDEGSGESACWDDLCHGGEVPCMHGDWREIPCNICGK